MPNRPRRFLAPCAIVAFVLVAVGARLALSDTAKPAPVSARMSVVTEPTPPATGNALHPAPSLSRAQPSTAASVRARASDRARATAGSRPAAGTVRIAAARTATKAPAKTATALPRATSVQGSTRTAGASDESSLVRGKATHYGPATAGGNCSYPTLPSPYTVAAGPDLYQASGGCGAILDVTGPHGTTVRVKVNNQCPECGPGHIDLTNEAFEKLAPLVDGLIPISYRIVANPPVEGGLQVKVKEGSSRWWLAVLVDNTGNRLRSVSILSDGAWKAMWRPDYNYWIIEGGAGPGPFTLRVQDVEGHVAVIHDVRLSPGVVQQTSVRLY